MKRLLLGIAASAVLLAMTAASSMAVSYAKFPPGPLGTCTDTMSIVTLKTNLAQVTSTGPCGAVTPNTTGTAGDTVLGLGGIITAFDEIPTGYDIFIETSGGGAHTGLDVFTGGTNMRAGYGFNLGDSIIVEYARVAVYYGDTELLSPNSNFSGPNIKLRKVSAGNTVPASVHGTPSDWLFQPNPGFPNVMAHWSELVTLDGPVTVVKTAITTGSSGVSGALAYCVRSIAPNDTALVDYFRLMGLVTPPAVGTVLTSATGILGGTSLGNSISPRSAADIIDAVPPGVTDAYQWIDDNTYRVVFDRAVTSASATNIGNYTLTSFGSVSAAVMDGTNAVLLTVTSNPHGTKETVKVTGVTGVANNITMTTEGDASFITGILTCGEMGTPDPDSLLNTPCQDKSRYAGPLGDYQNGQFGPRTTVAGYVTGIFGNLYYFQDLGLPAPNMAPGTHRGITVFAPPTAMTVGHTYMLAGADEEYYKENEFTGIVKELDQGAGTMPTPIPLTIAVASLDTCDKAQNLIDGKDYLSNLVQLTNVKVVKRFPTFPTNGFHVAGPFPTFTDTMFVENQNNVLGLNDSLNVNYPTVGYLVNVVGVEHYTTNTSTPSCRVCPRNAADITIVRAVGVPSNLPTKLSFAAYPNPARSVNLSFALPKAADVSLNVYDVFGRQVASIASGRMDAGTYNKSWSGLDASGQKVHSGMYFYRLRVGGEVRTARTMLVSN